MRKTASLKAEQLQRWLTVKQEQRAAALARLNQERTRRRADVAAATKQLLSHQARLRDRMERATKDLSDRVAQLAACKEQLMAWQRDRFSAS